MASNLISKFVEHVLKKARQTDFPYACLLVAPPAKEVSVSTFYSAGWMAALAIGFTTNAQAPSTNTPEPWVLGILPLNIAHTH